MKWKNRYQLLAFLFYLCAFNCFCLALFFPQLLQCIKGSTGYMVESCGLIQDVNFTKPVKKKQSIDPVPSPLPHPKEAAADKRVDNVKRYDITITQE